MAAAKKAAAKKAPAKKAAASNTVPETPQPVPSTPTTPDHEAAAAKAKGAANAPLGSPAERRADYLRALEEERDMCQRQGKDARVKAIDAEIKRVKSAPAGRQAPKSDEA